MLSSPNIPGRTPNPVAHPPPRGRAHARPVAHPPPSGRASPSPGPSAGGSTGSRVLAATPGLGGEPGELRARCCGGTSVRATHPLRGTHAPPRLGATPRAAWPTPMPRWVRHRGGGEASYASGHEYRHQGFLRQSPEKAEAGVRVREDSDEGAWMAAGEELERSGCHGWMDRTSGGTRTGSGTYVPGGGGTYVPAGGVNQR